MSAPQIIEIKCHMSVYLPFPFLYCPFFLSSPTAKMAGRSLSISTSNYAFSAKDVCFGVRKFKFNI